MPAGYLHTHKHQSKCSAEGLVFTHHILFVLKLCVKIDASCSNSSTYKLHWDLYQSNHTQTNQRSVGKYKDMWRINMVTEKETQMLISPSGEEYSPDHGAGAVFTLNLWYAGGRYVKLRCCVFMYTHYCCTVHSKHTACHVMLDLESGNYEILLTAVFIFVTLLVRGDISKKYVHTVCCCMKMMFPQWHILPWTSCCWKYYIP